MATTKNVDPTKQKQAKTAADVNAQDARTRLWQSLNTTYGNQMEESDKAYDRAISQQNNAMQARGMGRSSYSGQIMANMQNDKVSARNKLGESLIADYQNRIGQIEQQEAEDERWERQFAENQRQYNENLAFQQSEAERQQGNWLKEYQAGRSDTAWNRQFQQQQFNYQQQRDTVADTQWNKTFAENQRQFNATNEYNYASLAQNKELTQAQMAQTEKLTMAQMAQQLKMSEAELAQNKELTLAQLAQSKQLTLAQLAQQLNISEKELAQNKELTLAQLAQNKEQFSKNLELSYKQLQQNKELTLAQMAQQLNISEKELAQSKDLTLAQLAQNKELTMAELAQRLKISEAELAQNKDLTLAQLAQSDSHFKLSQAFTEQQWKDQQEQWKQEFEYNKMTTQQKLNYEVMIRAAQMGGDVSDDLLNSVGISRADFNAIKGEAAASGSGSGGSSGSSSGTTGNTNTTTGNEETTGNDFEQERATALKIAKAQEGFYDKINNPSDNGYAEKMQKDTKDKQAAVVSQALANAGQNAANGGAYAEKMQKDTKTQAQAKEQEKQRNELNTKLAKLRNDLKSAATDYAKTQIQNQIRSIENQLSKL